MNKRIQVETIVKFLDKDGRMNGGTIVTFKDSKALINTLGSYSKRYKLSNTT